MNQVGAGFLILQKVTEPHCKIKLNEARAG